MTVEQDGFWAAMQTRGPAEVVVDGTPVREGGRVRLRPRASADIVDLALRDRVAVVSGVEQDEQGGCLLAVTLEDDPGRDLGDARMPGHRFFFDPCDVEPLGPEPGADDGPRMLVAGIGNIFLGDDGFGVEVVRRLAQRPRLPGVDVVDFGIRGMDLVYALQRDYRAVVLVDAAPRGEPPGTLAVLEPEHVWHGPAAVETHGMDPVRVLRLAREFGPVPAQLRVVCCEPAAVPAEVAPEDVRVELSATVRRVVDRAVALVEETVAQLRAAPAGAGSRGGESA